MWKLHLTIRLLLALLLVVAVLGSERPKAYGHTIEYRYEYDPIKSKEPVVHWKYDNLNGQSKEGVLYPQHLHDVRKSPSKFDNKINYLEEPRDIDPMLGYHYNKQYRRQQWDDETDEPHRNEEAAERTRELTDAMSSFLREESKIILARHFPNFPFEFGPPVHNHQYPSRYDNQERNAPYLYRPFL